MIGSGEVKADLGLILAALAPRERAHLEAFNIPSDHPITLNKPVRLIADHGGMRVPKWRRVSGMAGRSGVRGDLGAHEEAHPCFGARLVSSRAIARSISPRRWHVSANLALGQPE